MVCPNESPLNILVLLWLIIVLLPFMLLSGLFEGVPPVNLHGAGRRRDVQSSAVAGAEPGLQGLVRAGAEPVVQGPQPAHSCIRMGRTGGCGNESRVK